MNVDRIVKVKTRSGCGINVRTGPGINYPKVRDWGFSEGVQIHVTELDNGWYKCSDGWICGDYLIVTQNNDANLSNNIIYVDSLKLSLALVPDINKGYTPSESELLNTIFNIPESDYTKSDIDNMQYIYGAPFQFTDITDPRPNGSKLGRSYLSSIMGDMSMMVITPGTTNFMESLSKEDSKNMLSALFGINYNDNEELSEVDNILQGKNAGRYYGFKSDYETYMKYVNNMCRIAATLLKLDDIKESEFYEGAGNYSTMDWDIKKMTDKSVWSFLSSDEESRSVAFYIDGKASSFSDGISNELGDSLFASMMDKGSDFAKEMSFLFGSGYSDDAIKETSKQNYQNAVEKVVKKLTSKDSYASKLVTRISDHADTLINGGNIAFPLLWKDSKYSKSYNIEIKLVSPYADAESFYLYILVPIFHLIALSYPRQLGANGYLNPPLIRAFCKGFFTCTLGMITSLDIKRASQEGWSEEGFPTEVDVTMSIADLYENLTITPTGDSAFFHNTEFLDMIAMWCGVNMNKPELKRKLLLWTAYIKSNVKDIPNILDEFSENISNKIRDFLT